MGHISWDHYDWVQDFDQDNYNQDHYDIFSYNIDTGNVEQLTELAGIRRFTVTRDGETLYGEQIRAGYSELVKVDKSMFSWLKNIQS